MLEIRSSRGRFISYAKVENLLRFYLRETLRPAPLPVLTSVVFTMLYKIQVSICPVTTVSFKASIERYVSNLPLLLDPPLRSLDDVFDVVPPFIGD